MTGRQPVNLARCRVQRYLLALILQRAASRWPQPQAIIEKRRVTYRVCQRHFLKTEKPALYGHIVLPFPGQTEAAGSPRHHIPRRDRHEETCDTIITGSWDLKYASTTQKDTALNSEGFS